MNSLEEISYSAVSAKGNNYADWRKTLRPRFGIVWRDIALGYAAIVITIVLSYFALLHFRNFHVLTVLAGALVLGFFLAYLSLFIHEASHFNIHPDKKKNDRLAALFLCLPFGLDIRSYRKIHWQHHLHLGTPQDTETSYFNALTPRFLLESFTGIHLLRVMKKKAMTGITEDMKKDSRSMLVAGGLFNLLVVAALFFLHWMLALQWIAGMLLFFPFFATLRQILEHRHDDADRETDYTSVPHGKIARLFSNSFFSRLFGAAGFNRHMIHHWDPQVSYTRLDDVENFLRMSAATKDLVQHSHTTYGRTLKKLLSR